jgi:hypothetical protein
LVLGVNRSELSGFYKEELAEKELLILGHQVQIAHQQAPFGAVTSGDIVLHGRVRAMLSIPFSRNEQLWSRDIIPVEQRFVTG